MLKEFISSFTLKVPRLADFAVIAILLALVILAFSPNLLTVTAYKLSLVTIAAWLGYRVDRSVFPYARPHKYLEEADIQRMEGGWVEADNNLLMGALATIRRAIIVAAVILAIALGA
jgi:Cu/Ag efflux pump CusA